MVTFFSISSEMHERVFFYETKKRGVTNFHFFFFHLFHLYTKSRHSLQTFQTLLKLSSRERFNYRCATCSKHVNHPISREDVNGPEKSRGEFENNVAVHAENDGDFIERTEEDERVTTRFHFRSVICDCKYQRREIQKLGKATGVSVWICIRWTRV